MPCVGAFTYCLWRPNWSQWPFMTHSESTQQQTRQIKEELTQLFNQQTEFYRRGGRTKLSASEIAQFDKRRQRIRALFAELEQWKPPKLV